jgi:hypothetical protein
MAADMAGRLATALDIDTAPSADLIAASLSPRGLQASISHHARSVVGLIGLAKTLAASAPGDFVPRAPVAHERVGSRLRELVQEHLDRARTHGERRRNRVQVCGHFFPRDAQWLGFVLALRVASARRLVEEALLRLARNLGRSLVLAGADGPALDEPLWAQSVLRESAAALMLPAVAPYRAMEVFDAATAVAGMAYEGRACRGSILLGSPRIHPPGEVRLRKPVSIGEHKTLRKILETCSETAVLRYSDAHGIVALCACPARGARRRTVGLQIRFERRGEWELVEGRNALFRVKAGAILAPGVGLSRAELAAAVFRQFSRARVGSVADPVEAIWQARAGGHGALIVIAHDARQECRRLRYTGFPLDGQPVDARKLEALTRMDGAVVLDPQGRIWGAGMILDGGASRGSTGGGGARRDGPRHRVHEGASRGRRDSGARHNAASRYVGAARGRIAIVVSEDGPVTLVKGRG